MAYPHPTADTLADGTIHVLGLGFAIPATILLTTYAASQGEQLTPTLVYAACFVLSLLASAIYPRQLTIQMALDSLQLLWANFPVDIMSQVYT